MARRSFGKLVKQRSGRWQASYMHNGERHYAPETFRTKTDGAAWLAQQEADISRGSWVGSEGAKIVFGDYAKEYLESPSIGDKWRDTCTRNLRLHLHPLLGKTLLALTPSIVRKWHTKALAGDGGRVSIAQSYRFMRAVMNQAVRDELVGRNPCQIPGAGSDQARERQIATPQQIEAVIAAIEPRYKAPVLIAAWCALRRQEVVRLRPADVDTEAATLRVSEAKSPAGVRTVAIPPHLIPYLEAAREWSSEEWFHTSPRKPHGRMVPITFYRAFARARDKVGLTHITIHDLRHTGNTLAANAGATTKDLMKRLGHATESAARRYLHTVEGRDAEIAKALSEVAKHGNAAQLPGRVQKSRKRKK